MSRTRVKSMNNQQLDKEFIYLLTQAVAMNERRIIRNQETLILRHPMFGQLKAGKVKTDKVFTYLSKISEIKQTGNLNLLNALVECQEFVVCVNKFNDSQRKTLIRSFFDTAQILRFTAFEKIAPVLIKMLNLLSNGNLALFNDIHSTCEASKASDVMVVRTRAFQGWKILKEVLPHLKQDFNASLAALANAVPGKANQLKNKIVEFKEYKSLSTTTDQDHLLEVFIKLVKAKSCASILLPPLYENPNLQVAVENLDAKDAMDLCIDMTILVATNFKKMPELMPIVVTVATWIIKKQEDIFLEKFSNVIAEGISKEKLTSHPESLTNKLYMLYRSQSRNVLAAVKEKLAAVGSKRKNNDDGTVKQKKPKRQKKDNGISAELMKEAQEAGYNYAKRIFAAKETLPAKVNVLLNDDQKHKYQGFLFDVFYNAAKEHYKMIKEATELGIARFNNLKVAWNESNLSIAKDKKELPEEIFLYYYKGGYMRAHTRALSSKTFFAAKVPDLKQDCQSAGLSAAQAFKAKARG